MPWRKHEGEKFNPNSKLPWILIAVLIGVVLISIYALIDPDFQNGETTPASPSVDVIQEAITPEGELQMMQTAEVEALPPTPEEIGYTNGIIFMSSLLILILLVGALREILHRRG